MQELDIILIGIKSEKLKLTSAQTGGDLEGNGMEGMKGYDFDGRKKERERLERREQPPSISLPSFHLLASDSWTNDQSDGEKMQTNLLLDP